MKILFAVLVLPLQQRVSNSKPKIDCVLRTFLAYARTANTLMNITHKRLSHQQRVKLLKLRHLSVYCEKGNKIEKT